MPNNRKTKYKYLGKRVAKVDSGDKVTGKAVFGSDLRLDNMVFGKILCSPYAHARITSIDTSVAERADGVVAVITGDDFPNLPKGSPVNIGKRVADIYSISQVVMARDKVHFYGQPVAAVAASTAFEAEMALSFKDSLIGINNRNLNTLEVSLNTSVKLSKILNSHQNPLICESGIHSTDNIKFIIDNAGIYNFLIGESLLKSQDIKSKLKQFTQISL